MSQRHRQILGAALFPLGAFVVHQLRYLLAFGSDTSHELAEQGHAYLHELAPWIMLAAALGLGGLLARLARALRSGDARQHVRRRLAGLWAFAACGLLAVYVGQELLEGLLASGHVHGIAGTFGSGGLWSLPACVVVGGLLAVVVHGGQALVAAAARLHRRRARTQTTRASGRVLRPDPVALPRVAPLAGESAGRAPPLGVAL